MTLPTKKTPALVNLHDYSIMVYGSSGLGKTTFASQAPNVLFLATEPGTNALDCYVQPVHTWEEFTGALGELINTEHPFETVCIDTADNAYAMCAAYICKQRGIKGPEDQKPSESYPPITREFKRVFTRLASLPIGLITIAHDKTVTIKTKVSEYDKTIPAMPGSPGDFLVGLHDIVMLADIQTTKNDKGELQHERVLYTKPSAEHCACDRTSRLPETLPLNYQAVEKAFIKGAKK